MCSRDEGRRDDAGPFEDAEPSTERVGRDVERLGELALVQALRLGAGHAQGFEDQEEGEGLRPESPEAFRPRGEDPRNVPVHQPRESRGRRRGGRSTGFP